MPSSTHLIARISPVEPAELARALPRIGFLAAIDAPVAVEAVGELGPTLNLRQAQVTVQAGPGMLHIGTGTMPIVDASVTASGTPDIIRVDTAKVRFRPRPNAVPTNLTATGAIRRESGQIDADLVLDLDQVAFSDLPTLWPAGVARNTRAWILQNITAGVAQDGHLSIGLEANADLSGVTLTRASGSLEGSGLTVSWLRPVPPIVQGNAMLHVVGPDSLQIDVTSGRQSLTKGALSVTGGSVRITGLMQRDQVADIQLSTAGSLPDVIALLREPRLQLLARHPISLNNPAGNVNATVAATVPLDARVRIDDIDLHVAAHIDHAALAGLLVGRNLSDGALDIAADNDGLTVKGNARLGGIPAALDVAMDFRAGPPTQVLQRATINGRPDAKQLTAAGLDVTDFLSGPIGLQAVLTEQRDGTGGVAVNANLSAATLTVAPLDWRQPLGTGANATAQVRLRHDQLDGIDGITANGDGLALRGSARCDGGRIAAVRLDRLVLGRTEGQATVSLPSSPRVGPIEVRVAGPELDLSARLAQPTTGRHPRQPEPPPGPPWTLDAHFDRVLMAHGHMLAPLRVQAANDGRVFRQLLIDGATREKGPFSLQIAPEGTNRRLTASASQAGDLLRALDVTDTMQGGRLTVSGTYDDAAPGHPLSGTGELTDFHVAHEVVLGKLLQAMTLYGLVDVVRGPGLAFTRMVAPFSLSDGMLTLTDTRAFSPSLGLTAQGQIDLDANTIDLLGTIVPAYFFNSLLGNVPLVGRLFSPERGGGLFAASYSVKGDLNNPAVGVNPLTALTPGFLRGLFRLF